MKLMDPFANESESMQIEGLTIENRTDRVSLYGDIDITRDKKGLKAAKELAALLSAIVQRLSSEDIPDSVPPSKEPGTVKNPFE